jgi:hypothetical protein
VADAHPEALGLVDEVTASSADATRRASSSRGDNTPLRALRGRSR